VPGSGRLAAWPLRRPQLVMGVLLVPLIGLTAHGQVRRSTIGTVEFIGLEQWTPELIQQKLGYQNVDGLHYCAQDLKEAGFPEVSVVGYMEDGRRYSVVTVIEPSRAHDVLYLKEPRGTVRTPANWSDLRALLRDSQLFGGAVLDYGRTLPTASQNQPWLASGWASTAVVGGGSTTGQCD
jgi:hypothetical protein